MTLPTQQNFHLVERNIHEISVDSRRLLFHIPSSSLFQLDELSGELIDLFKKWPDRSPDQVLHAMQPRFEAADISTTFSELQSLEVKEKGRTILVKAFDIRYQTFFVFVNGNGCCRVLRSDGYKAVLNAGTDNQFSEIRHQVVQGDALAGLNFDECRYDFQNCLPVYIMV